MLSFFVDNYMDICYDRYIIIEEVDYARKQAIIYDI